MIRHAILMFLILAAAGCQTTDEVKIAWIGPLSGDVATIGQASLEGVQLAIQDLEASGQDITLIIEDDGYDTKRSLEAFHKVTSVDNVDAVLMVTYGGFIASAPFADAAKVVTVNALDTSEEIAKAGDYAFGIGAYDEGIGHAMAEHLKSRHDTAALINLHEDPYPVLVARGFSERFSELGGEILLTETYGWSTTDYRTTLTKVKELEPEALVIIGYDEAGLAFREALELGIDVTYYGADTIASEGFKSNAGPAAEGIFFPYWEAQPSAKYNAFQANYEQTYSKEPAFELYVVTGYDAMNAVAEAMSSGTNLRDGMYALDTTGVAGTIKMEPDGIVRTIELSMYQLVDGEFVQEVIV